MVNSWLTPARWTAIKTQAADGFEPQPRLPFGPARKSPGARPLRSSGPSCPSRSRSSASGAAGDGFRGAPLIWGMELLRLRRSLLFTRAISRPAVRVVFRLARGFRARRLLPQFCRLTFRQRLLQSRPSPRASLTAGAQWRPRADPPAWGLFPSASAPLLRAPDLRTSANKRA